jgi:hypothetical protein
VIRRGGAAVGLLPAAIAVAGATLVALLMPAGEASAGLNPRVPDPYRSLLEQAASACAGLPPEVLAAQLMQESGFDPSATSLAGAVGIAQFMPATWTAWGRDADRNGVASPFDPADAIDAQGRLMCDLLRRAEASTLPGDPLQLALAGYNAGWGAVLAYGGIPPYAETRAYVAKIVTLAAQFAGGSGFATAGVFGDLPRANPRSVNQAITFARAAVQAPDVWYRRCLNFVAQAYGYRFSGTSYAIDHYRVVMPASMRHDGDRRPPPGALLFWDTGSRAGHVALYLGGGLVATNDIDAPGAISIVAAAEVERRWGATYLGWSPPYFPAGG